MLSVEGLIMADIRLFGISLLLPLLAIATVADAGVTISDSRYWPYPSVYRTSDTKAAGVAHRRTGGRFRSPKACTYRGGPKTGTWSCQ
jgi:hypothetical protein